MMKHGKDITAQVVESIQDKKGHGIVILDLSDIEGASCSKCIIATGNSTSQVSSIADNVREEVHKKAGVKPFNYDGYRNSEWIVIDYGDVVVHIFLPDVRQRYDLEGLWSDAEISEIPDLD